jgi:hypothetical protein
MLDSNNNNAMIAVGGGNRCLRCKRQRGGNRDRATPLYTDFMEGLKDAITHFVYKKTKIIDVSDWRRGVFLIVYTNKTNNVKEMYLKVTLDDASNAIKKTSIFPGKDFYEIPGYDLEMVSYHVLNGILELEGKVVDPVILNKVELEHPYNINLKTHLFIDTQTTIGLNKWLKSTNNRGNGKLKFRLIGTHGDSDYHSFKDNIITILNNKNIDDDNKVNHIFNGFIHIMKTILIAHESKAGFVHADLHAGNIMVNKEDVTKVKLFDFDFSTIKYNNKQYVSSSHTIYEITDDYLTGHKGFLFDFIRLLLSTTIEINTPPEKRTRSGSQYTKELRNKMMQNFLNKSNSLFGDGVNLKYLYTTYLDKGVEYTKNYEKDIKENNKKNSKDQKEIIKRETFNVIESYMGWLDDNTNSKYLKITETLNTLSVEK